MFHQIRLLPQDKPLLRFLWRDMNKDVPPSVHQWQVLPFGTTCSPCCAIYALQKHVKDNQPDREVQDSVTHRFYVDNCLQSFPSSVAAQTLLDKLRAILSSEGFDLRQWASNDPTVISHLPSEARSDGSELWLSENRTDLQERTLGLLWNCKPDFFKYKYRTLECLTTQCVHLDLLNNMDTDSFLMAFQRFTSRRGTPAEILCDQGTNFKGGHKELQEAFNNLSPTIKSVLATRKINFHFNPPYAPHFGGVWEREIRSVKNALKTTIGAQMVTEEVLRTVLMEIEGILNSKPLGYVSSDVADTDPVTPNLLIMGRHDASLPLVSYPDSDLLSRRRWRHTQILSDHFWKHFIKSYLPLLQTRQKWKRDKPDLTLNSIVMIVDSQHPRALWPVGKVTHLLQSKDGCIRTAKVLVKDKTYVRPVANLIPLPAIPKDTH
ncbi:hypothetical protein N1851_014104 [Merluccius polli]|uniref:Integrase catalytic domain-containing protein n=1 Tax=Merluccius polli TaxID=89951 RepID=A0AA47MUT7_MERPO|nr:hypothetical protein N1851_014104 [Merluccius polli]